MKGGYKYGPRSPRSPQLRGLKKSDATKGKPKTHRHTQKKKSKSVTFLQKYFNKSKTQKRKKSKRNKKSRAKSKRN